MVLRMTRWMAVLVAMLSMGQAAFAQGDSDAAALTRECVQAMHDTSVATVDYIQAAAATGIAEIQRLDATGATNEEIIAAARHTVRAVNNITHRGSRHIDIIAARCLQALRAMHADPRFARIILEGRRHAKGAIAKTHDRAIHAVRVALREALGGG